MIEGTSNSASGGRDSRTSRGERLAWESDARPLPLVPLLPPPPARRLSLQPAIDCHNFLVVSVFIWRRDLQAIGCILRGMLLHIRR